MKTLIAALALGSAALLAQAPPAGEQDAYTRIELRDPATGTFKVMHEVSVTTAGDRQYELPLWPGTQVSGLKVTDLMSGAPLQTAIAARSRRR